MVLKYEGAPDEVYYLEANGGDNVSFSTYSNIKSLIGNRIQKFAIRHIEMERTDEHLALVSQFIQEAR